MKRIKELEQLIEETWIEGDYNFSIDSNNYADLITYGIDECEAEHYCIWREIAPNGFCRCIRTVLPSLDAYLLYKKLRDTTQQLLIAKELKSLTDTYEEYDKCDHLHNTKKTV